ncbi:hypothetical protein BDZ45DRAFT_743800 [Acephala macrosclerotiorum]|nr:hypothetical protein BDZ45DRAFT_743800 [Acephala macrosclerotiorum]
MPQDHSPKNRKRLLNLPDIKCEKDITDVYTLTEEQRQRAYHAELSKIEASDPDHHSIQDRMYDVRLRPILELRDMIKNIIRVEENKASIKRKVANPVTGIVIVSGVAAMWFSFAYGNLAIKRRNKKSQ